MPQNHFKPLDTRKMYRKTNFKLKKERKICSLRAFLSARVLATQKPFPFRTKSIGEYIVFRYFFFFTCAKRNKIKYVPIDLLGVPLLGHTRNTMILSCTTNQHVHIDKLLLCTSGIEEREKKKKGNGKNSR